MATQGTRRALKPEEEHAETPAGPRPFWSGTISFGLVSIPVNLFPGVRSGGIRTRMLAADGTPVRRRYFCPKDEQDLDYQDLVRGYEVEENEYVVLTDEELEAIAPRKSRDIDLRRFVGVDELDPFLFERAYVLTPGGESEKAYRLLAEVMEREKKAGIATFVMRGKEYLVAIMAEKGILRAETLRFNDEVRTPRAVDLPESGRAPAKLVAAFEREIDKAAKADLSREELSDQRTKKLQELVERKRRANEDLITAPYVEASAEEDEEGGGDIDLMEAIRRSLRGDGGGERGKPHRAREGARRGRARSKPAPSRARSKAATARPRTARTTAKGKRS